MHDSVALIRLLMFASREAKILQHEETEVFLTEAIIKLYAELKLNDTVPIDDDMEAEVEKFRSGDHHLH